MGKSLTAMALTIGLGFTAAAGAQPAQPTYGQMPDSGQMMGQGQMMGGQNAVMNDPQMRRQMTDMMQGCERTMARTTERSRTQQRNR